MDKIERFKIFCLVAEKHSFAQVAKELDLPRSTITYAIQALEKEYEIFNASGDAKNYKQLEKLKTKLTALTAKYK